MPRSRIANKIKKLTRYLTSIKYVHIGKNTKDMEHDTVVKYTLARNPEFTKIRPFSD